MRLEIKNLSFAYDSAVRKQSLTDKILKKQEQAKPPHLAVNHVSLSLTDGQILCLMGQNGSGKSTLLNCIMGIYRPQEGQIFLDQKNLSSAKRHEIAKSLAYVPQLHQINFPYTVREAVLMGRTAYISAIGGPSDEDLAISEKAMDRVGIRHLADKNYGSISGGELRLVLLARALSQQTKVILMDEPTAHLDYHNELYFMEMVSELCKNDGISILMATHAPAQAFYFEHKGNDTRSLFLKNGRMITEGIPSEVITSDLLKEVYEIEAKILDYQGEKTILLQKSL